MAASMNMTVFWDAAPCSLAEIYRFLEGLTASTIRAMNLMMEAVSTSETSVNFCETTRRNIPEDICLNTLLYTS
jgi:hypothetical protein